VGAVLWRSRFEQLVREGRERCHAHVRQALASELAVFAPRLAERVWRELKPLLGDRLRSGLR
jgi:hypothetical protein